MANTSTKGNMMHNNMNNYDKNNTKSPRLGRLRNLSPPSREKPSNTYLGGGGSSSNYNNNNTTNNQSTGAGALSANSTANHRNPSFKINHVDDNN